MPKHLEIADIQEAAGSFQLCGGHISGIEVAVHAVCILRLIKRTLKLSYVLTDASNAFNSLNCQVALPNIRNEHPCHPYKAPSELFADGDISEVGVAYFRVYLPHAS